MAAVFTRSRVLLILSLLTIAAYAPALQNSFVWDDDLLVTNNSYIRNPSYLPAIFTADLFHNYNTLVATHYRPVQAVTFLVDYAIWGNNAFGFHLTNLLLHLGCVLLLALLVERWSGNRLLALGVAGLFAVHPINANAIAYVSGRADPLALGFMLVTLLLLHVYRNTPPVSRVRRIFLYALLMLSFAAGMFSRENALLTPLIVLIVVALLPPKPEHNFRAAVLAALPFVLLAVAFYFWRAEVLRLQGKPTGIAAASSVWERLQVMFRSLAVYCGLLFWPARLQMERQVTSGPGLSMLTAAGVGCLSALVFLLVWTRRRVPLAFLGLVWFIATLAPQMGLLSLNASVAEHWLYVPSIGFYLAFVAIGLRFWPADVHWQRLIVGVFGLALAALTTRTIFRCHDWSTPMTLFTQTKKAAPESANVRSNLGNEFAQAGQTNRAIAEFQMAERLDPDYVRIKVNFARFYFQQGNLPEARRKVEESLAIAPDNVAALLLLADILDQQRDFKDANQQFIRASVLTMDVRPLIRHGTFLLQHHRLSLARAIAEEAYLIEPGNEAVSELLGAVLTGEGRLAEARTAFERAKRLDRFSPDPDINLGKLAAQANDLVSAEAYYRSALDRQPDDPLIHYQLGVILWRRQDYDQAQSELETAQQAMPQSATVRQTLERLKRREPYQTATPDVSTTPHAALPMPAAGRGHQP